MARPDLYQIADDIVSSGRDLGAQAGRPVDRFGSQDAVHRDFSPTSSANIFDFGYDAIHGIGAGQSLRDQESLAGINAEFRNPDGSLKSGAGSTGSSGSGSGSRRGGGGVAVNGNPGVSSSGFIQNYINESISPLVGLRNDYNSQETGLLAALTEKYGLQRTSNKEDKARSGKEIGVSQDETEAIISELLESQGIQQNAMTDAAGNARSSINAARDARQSQLLRAIEAGGGDVDQLGAGIAGNDANVSREQSANATALSATQASGTNQLNRAAARTSTIEQSAMSDLANNFRKASQTLDAAELEAETTITTQFAEQRSQLEFKIAEATVAAKREAEDILKQQAEAARMSGGGGRGGGGGGGGGGAAGVSEAGLALTADYYGIPLGLLQAAEAQGAGAYNALVNGAMDRLEGNKKSQQDLLLQAGLVNDIMAITPEGDRQAQLERFEGADILTAHTWLQGETDRLARAADGGAPNPWVASRNRANSRSGSYTGSYSTPVNWGRTANPPTSLTPWLYNGPPSTSPVSPPGRSPRITAPRWVREAQGTAKPLRFNNVVNGR